MSWEKKASEPKIAICIAHQNLTYIDWALRFRRLNVPFTALYCTSRGHPIDVARNTMVKTAMKYDSVQWIFFLDSDILVEPDTLIKLLRWKFPVVSALYFSKTGNWCAYVKSKDSASYHPIKSFKGKLLLVDAVGMGCCLIRREVFEVVNYPWFEWTLSKKHPGYSEDLYFCDSCRKAEIPIYIDTTAKVGHVEPLKLIGPDEADWLET